MSNSTFDSPTTGLRQHATNGAVITGLSQGVKFVVQTGSVVVLARILTPVDYGLLAMVTPLLGFVMMFQDFGLTQATIQKPDITHEQVSALFWLNLGFSLVLSILLIAAAPLVASFYKDARVCPLTVAFGCLVFVNGCSSQHMALLNRQMRFGALALIDTAAAALSFVAALSFALLWDNYWALFAGSLVLSLVPVIGSWALVRWVPGRPATTDGLQEILNFGGGITGFGFANFFARNLDNVLIGWRWGEQPLGTYDRAYKLLLMPLQQVNAPLGRVMLPVLSRLAQEPDRYRLAFLNTLRQLLLVVLPGVVFMIVTSNILVVALLGSEWHEAGRVFQALGFAALVQVLNNPSGWLFVSQARTREFMLWGFFSSATTIVAFAGGLWAGPLGVATAYAISEFIRTPLLWAVTTRTGPIRFGDLVQTTAPHAIAVAVTLTVGELLVQLISTAYPFVVLAVALAGCYTVYCGVIALFRAGREAILESLSLAGSMTKRMVRVR